MLRNRSVEVLLRGGLGNQMFQYAIGRCLSIRLGLPLVIDSSSLKFDAPVIRGYELSCFKLSRHRIRNQAPWLARTRTRLLSASKCYRMGLPYLIKERSLRFDPEVLKQGGPCLLDGYWQSERYFEPVADKLRADFAILPARDSSSAGCLERMRRRKSIGLHVRRGDYVTNSGSSAFHGTCPKEYYDSALKLCRSRLGTDVELFVFSDDIEWTRQNIRFAIPTTYVDWNADRGYEDLRLMSACSALVIANSAFSWWAGWLNPDPEKTVIAPRRWFKAPAMSSDLPDSRWLIAL